MFSGCTSLTEAPELPATTLADGCYKYMFSGCKKLTKASVLPATTLTYSCYESMYNGCSALTIAPDLLAPTISSHGYRAMFYGCGNLSYIKMLATDISAEECLYLFTYAVRGEAGRTFVKHPNMNDLPSG